MNDAAERQRQVGQEVMGANHAAHWKIRHRRIDVRHQMQAAGPDPRSLDHDIGQVDRDQLADFEAAVEKAL